MSNHPTRTLLSWRFNAANYQDKLVVIAVLEELERARAKHPAFPADVVHQAGIVSEESGELMKAAIDNSYHGGPINDLLTEAVQTAATAIRLVVFHSTHDQRADN